MDYKKFTASKNNKNLKRFLSVPADKRIIFVPQCLRNVKKCKAEEFGSFYICAGCGACKIAAIQKAATDKGYIAVRILKGGSTVKKAVRDLRPKAILGVACYFEGAQGIKECEKRNIPVYFYPLSRDGCENTDLKLPALLKIIKGETG
ncbi:MAG: DUF116 domain-containing protein [Elusimicrobia bacterium]|nr:DUF116 domain-containing protein [Elusimicrobiota bacterium]